MEFGLHLRRWPGVEVAPVEWYRRQVEPLPEAFTTVWVSDHFQDESPNLECWTLLTYLAASFPRFKVGTLVLGQGYRNPALLAKMGATLQFLTGGRFVMGIGAGWAEPDHTAYGFGFPSRKDRVEQLAETIQILRAMWTDSPATFNGRHYRIEGAYCEPRPDPMIPIMVGTKGPKALRVAAEFADWWNWDAPAEAFDPPLQILHEHCADIERNPSTITLTASAWVHLPRDLADWRGPQNSGYEDVLAIPLGPTPADAVHQLVAMRDRGVAHIMVLPEDQATLDRFCGEVVPTFER